uniref:DUF7808 domain-containing protein n=1 Tax=Steinernema glaseri TaxID=37863 RepID=A0A1I7YVR1_9BILA
MSLLQRLVIALAIVLGLCLAHPQFRQLKCVTPNGLIRAGPDCARCNMIIKDAEDEEPGRPASEGEGCFSENHNGEERVYCALVCPKAHTVFNSHLDQGHRACFNFYTYQLEQRGEDWFLWRSGKCLNSTGTFTVGCKFDAPFNTQFKNDNEVFGELRRARARFAKA